MVAVGVLIEESLSGSGVFRVAVAGSDSTAVLSRDFFVTVKSKRCQNDPLVVTLSASCSALTISLPCLAMSSSVDLDPQRRDQFCIRYSTSSGISEGPRRFSILHSISSASSIFPSARTILAWRFKNSF